SVSATSPSTHGAGALSAYSFDERVDLGARAQVENALRGCALGDQRAIFRRETRVAAPNDAVAVHGAAPDRAVRRPAFRCREEPEDQPFRDPPLMGDEWEVGKHQRIVG